MFEAVLILVWIFLVYMKTQGKSPSGSWSWLKVFLLPLLVYFVIYFVLYVVVAVGLLPYTYGFYGAF